MLRSKASSFIIDFLFDWSSFLPFGAGPRVQGFFFNPLVASLSLPFEAVSTFSLSLSPSPFLSILSPPPSPFLIPSSSLSPSARIVAVEQFPTANLFTDRLLTPPSDLSTFSTIGLTAKGIAELLNSRREAERAAGSSQRTAPATDPAPSFVGDDSLTLNFALRTDILVKDPVLLLKQTGVSELVRLTVAKAVIKGDQMCVVYASALREQMEGEGGDGLRRAVESFEAL